MSLLKKLKKAYDAGRELSTEEQDAFEKAKTNDSLSRKYHLEIFAKRRVTILKGLQNPTILEEMAFYAGRVGPYFMHV